MSLGNYTGISVREAMEKINNGPGGWYLPRVQRQYVWGNRESSEEYICLLLDSLLKGYPIGGLVLWETDKEIGYREFLKDYSYGAVARMVPKERFGWKKFLVYDGQQRLQTLYSVLNYRFNERTLYFNLLFDEKENDADETGFYFKSEDKEKDPFSISMIELMGKQQTITEKANLRNRYCDVGELSNVQKLLIETNLDKLWDVFVKTDNHSLAYFPVKSNSEVEVNEVFRRLNTGGVQLSQLELVLGKIKEQSTYFEEELWELTSEIKKATGTPGIDFSAFDIMQLIYLLVFKTTRVDEGRVNKDNRNLLIEKLTVVTEVLPHFFKMFFYECFHITAKWLIFRQQAILPMLAYVVTLRTNEYKWKPEQIDISLLKEYFIRSQLCDWNTQTMVTNFAGKAIESAEKGEAFPLFAITQIAIDKNRTPDVHFYQIEGPKWFSLKILTPDKMYLFNEQTPQIDHVFPLNLHKGQNDENEYRERVDVLWNMQPTPAGINRKKWDTHPVEFFKSNEGKSFITAYSFLPPTLDSDEWKDEISFIEFRKRKMLEFMKLEYNIEVKDNPVG